MSSSTDSSFWKEQASETRPGNSRSASSRISGAPIASTAPGSGSVNVLAVREQHLLQRVAAQTEPERLERDDLVGRDVSEVDIGPEVLDEPGLRGLGRRLPHEVVEVDGLLDLGD